MQYAPPPLDLQQLQTCLVVVSVLQLVTQVG